jgi:hypothetical protein
MHIYYALFYVSAPNSGTKHGLSGRRRWRAGHSLQPAQERSDTEVSTPPASGVRQHQRLPGAEWSCCSVSCSPHFPPLLAPPPPTTFVGIDYCYIMPLW